MRLTADLQSIAHVDPKELSARIGLGQEQERGVIGGRQLSTSMRSFFGRGSVLRTGLAMSAACAASILAASALHRGSAWAGLNAIPSGLGLSSRRPSKRFDSSLALTSVGIIVGGSILVALLQNQLASGIGKGRFGRAAMTGVGSWAMDRYVLRRSLIPALENTLGPIGAIAKYAAIGIAAAMTKRVA